MQTAQRNRLEDDIKHHIPTSNTNDGPVVVDDTVEEEEDEIPPELRAHLPMSFGSSKPQDQIAARAQLQQEKQRAAEISVQRKHDDFDTDFHNIQGGEPVVGPNPTLENEEDDDVGPVPAAIESDPWRLPISSEISLKGQ